MGPARGIKIEVYLSEAVEWLDFPIHFTLKAEGETF